MLRKLLKLTGNNNYSLLKHSTQIKLFGTEQGCEDEDADHAETKHSKRITETFGKYMVEDVEKILNVINNYSLNDLLGYEISKTRANNLLAHRMSHELKDLTDIFLVKGFGLKVADKFYRSLLEEPKQLRNDLNKRVKTPSFIVPQMAAELRTKNVKSCVAVRIGVNSITWSKLELASEELNYPCQLSHWQHHEISEKKLHLNELIQRCLHICHQIPTADCYVFENPQMAQASNNPGSVELQNINIQKAQVTAMMGYALAARKPANASHCNDETVGNMEQMTTNLPVVFYVRRLLTARLFSHLVGTERVSSEQTLLDLMRLRYNPEDMEEEDDLPEDANTQQIESAKARRYEKNLIIRRSVDFPIELREMYSKAPRYYREFLGQALLLNLAFVRLVLLQDPKSIAQVTRGGGNKTDIISEQIK